MFTGSKARTVSDAHTTNQPGDGISIEDIPDHSVGFALVEAAFGTASDDTTRILAAVLQEGQALRDFRGSIDGGVMQEKAKDTTHCLLCEKEGQRQWKRTYWSKARGGGRTLAMG